ncbi:hypothetical protein TNCV_1352751 [Trichonephila clavipes]|nr:hypothetical protein TNCV_1352751 [Trichonephila clavipes]
MLTVSEKILLCLIRRKNVYVMEFDKESIVSYQERGLSFCEISTRINRNLTTFMHLMSSAKSRTACTATNRGFFDKAA